MTPNDGIEKEEQGNKALNTILVKIFDFQLNDAITGYQKPMKFVLFILFFK